MVGEIIFPEQIVQLLDRILIRSLNVEVAVNAEDVLKEVEEFLPRARVQVPENIFRAGLYRLV